MQKETSDPPDDVIIVKIKEKEHVPIVTIEDDSFVIEDINFLTINNSSKKGAQSDKAEQSKATGSTKVKKNAAVLTTVQSISEEMDIVILDNSSCNGIQPDKLQTSNNSGTASGNVTSEINVPVEVDIAIVGNLPCNGIKPGLLQTCSTSGKTIGNTRGKLKVAKLPVSTSTKDVSESVAFRPLDMLRLEEYIKETKRILIAEMGGMSKALQKPLGNKPNNLKVRKSTCHKSLNVVEIVPSDKHETEIGPNNTLKNAVQLEAETGGSQDLKTQFIKKFPSNYIPILLQPYEKLVENGAKNVLEKALGFSDTVVRPKKQATLLKTRKSNRNAKTNQKTAASDLLSSQEIPRTSKRKLKAMESCGCANICLPAKAAKMLPNDFAGSIDKPECAGTASTVINGKNTRSKISKKRRKRRPKKKKDSDIFIKDANHNNRPPSLPSDDKARASVVTISIADSTLDSSAFEHPEKNMTDKRESIAPLGTDVNPILILDLSCAEPRSDAECSKKTCSRSNTPLVQVNSEIEVVSEITSTHNLDNQRKENVENVRQEPRNGNVENVQQGRSGEIISTPKDIELICEINIPSEKEKTRVPQPASKPNINPTFQLSAADSSNSLPLTRFVYPQRQSAPGPMLCRTIFNERAAGEFFPRPEFPRFSFHGTAFQFGRQVEPLLPIPPNIMHGARMETMYSAETYVTQDAVNHQSSLSIMMPQNSNLGSLRPVAIDGSNVAFSHGKERHFSCKGIQICIDYFLKKGHTVKAFVPQFRRKAGYGVVDQRLLETLGKSQLVVFTPSRDINGHNVACYDDRFILEYSARTGAVIVSNDNYRDLMKENPSWKSMINERLLMYAFADDHFLVPEDPLGKNGPRLSQFLRF